MQSTSMEERGLVTDHAGIVLFLEVLQRVREQTHREGEMMREQHDDLCYCKPGLTGHVHAAKISPEEWAEGVLAIDFLGRSSMAMSTPKLTPKNRRAAEAIINRREQPRGKVRG